jgi:hypothetical protein
MAKFTGKGPGKGGQGEHPPPDGKVRQSQAITTYGPGAMVDLLQDAVLVGGLEFWGRKGRVGFDEPRLRGLLQKRFPLLRDRHPFVLPPAGDDRHPSRGVGVQVLEFPRWFVCQNPACRSLAVCGPMSETKAGRYVHDCAKGSYFVPVRFVMACPNGHIDEFPWSAFVHQQPGCQGPDLKLLEGATGEFAELVVYCAGCKQRRPMLDATVQELNFQCLGAQPWLNQRDPAGCDRKLRLLVRTASNAYFPQVVSSLDIPEARSARAAVDAHWDVLAAASAVTLPAFRHIPHISQALREFSDEEVLEAVEARKQGRPQRRDPLRTAEFKQFCSAQPERSGDYPGPAEQFFIREVSLQGGLPGGVQRVVLAHRLREVRVQTGFTRFEASTPNLEGEYPEEDIGVRTAPLAAEVRWLPGVEVRGEGVFVQLDEEAVRAWEGRPEVKAREDALRAGYQRWVRRRTGGRAEKELLLPAFHGGRFYLLHSLAHLLIQAMSLSCGYSASAIRERIYCAGAGEAQPMAAILLSTGTTGTEGTLGGLLAQGRALRQHLSRAYDLGVLCSNDPVCAAHEPAQDPTERTLEGAACHGCLFIAEPSCEQFNGFLDRAMVFPTMGQEGAAFFRERP